MSAIKTEILEFAGAHNVVMAAHIRHENSAPRLAVVLPGAGYSYKQPLLHFAIQALLAKNFQVLALDKIYGDDPKWRSLNSEQEARKIVEEDALKVIGEIESRIGIQPDTFLGRSLGTYAIACALEKKLIQPKQIVWQTPALGSKWEIMKNCSVRGFGILGTADFYYKEALGNLPKDRIIIENADHGMEIGGRPLDSIDALRKVTQATYEWIQN